MPNVSTPGGLPDTTSSVKASVRTASRSLRHTLGLDRLAVILGLALAIAVIYWPGAEALNGVWRGSAGHTYTQGYLLLLAAIFLIVRDRTRLGEYPVRPSRGAWFLLVALSAAWVWSWRAVLQEPQLLLMPALWLAAVAGVLGRPAARALAVPVGLLYFAMPFWGSLTGPLQSLSARADGALVWLTGVPAYMQGNLIELPAGSIRIAGDCSGLDGLVVGLALATLYGEISRDPPLRRLTWLGLMGALSLMINWLRIFTITVVAYESDMRAALVHHHIWLGELLFASAAFGALWFAEAWRRRHPAGRDRPQPYLPPAEGAIRPVSAGVTLACLASLPALVYAVCLVSSAPSAALGIQWPPARAGWRGPEPVLASEWRPRFVGPSAEALRGYADAGGQSVEIFEVAYGRQTQSAKLLYYMNSILGDANLLQSRAQRVANSPAGRWRETLAVDGDGSRSLIWSRYAIDDRRFVRPLLAQLWYGIAALAGQPVFSLTALRAVCTPGCAAARLRLGVAAAEVLPSLRRN